MLNFIPYVDDTNMFYKHENIDIIFKNFRFELDKLSTWLALSKLALNMHKLSLNILVFVLIIRSRGKISLLIFK